MIPRTMRRAARLCAMSAGLATLLVPTAAEARFGKGTLEVGDRGRDVKIAQKYLTRAGIRTTADGVYGRRTAMKVKRFERSAKLRKDGKLSPRDARALKRAARRGSTRGADGNGGAEAGQAPAEASGEKATLSADGRTAIAPASAPPEVKQAIASANEITDKPYRYGGGHGSFEDSGYDCSGAVSYAVREWLEQPLDSSGFMSWGEAGEGQWISVYAHSGHAYVVIAGLRFDTSGEGEKGPRWRPESRSSRGYTVRHPKGF
jgi:cell wall-associated NlpC family hydrolase